MLLLDNCSVDKVDTGHLRPGIHLVFLPPNAPNTYQLLDMEIFTSLKVGYKKMIPGGLLDMFDEGEGSGVTSGLRSSGVGSGGM